MDKYMYPSLKARIQAEYKIYLLAFLFIAIADKIGQIKIPFGLGTFILFPIFYSLILGILSGPQVAKIVKSGHHLFSNAAGSDAWLKARGHRRYPLHQP